MDYVCLSAHAEIATESARFCVAAISHAYHFSEHGHYVDPFKAHHYYRSGSHAFYDGWEERTVNQMSIMLFQDILIKLHHLQAGNNKTFALNA